jgi:hypothetical protein
MKIGWLKQKVILRHLKMTQGVVRCLLRISGAGVIKKKSQFFQSLEL